MRFWWLAAVALFIVGTYFCADGALGRAREAAFLRDAIPLQAKVIEADGVTMRGSRQPPESAVVLRFDWHGSPQTTAARPLAGRTESISVGEMVPIRVDPADPGHWTTQQEPSPIVGGVLGGLMVVAAAMVPALVSLMAHQRVVRFWRDGELAEALVVESRHTALAPRSQAVRCTPADGGDNRAFTVYIPARAGPREPGDTVRILYRPGLAGGAVAVEWFV